MRKEDAPILLQFLEATALDLSSCCNKIPTAFNAMGNVTEHGNLITDYYKDVSLKRLQRQAHRRYGTAVSETDPIPATPFALRTIDPANNDTDKGIFYD